MLDFPGLAKKMVRVRAYKRLFLADDGQLKPDAETVLNDLYDFTRFFKAGASADPLALAVLEGSRQVVRRILTQTRTTSRELKRHLTTGENDE